jgi:hypothetical protein
VAPWTQAQYPAGWRMAQSGLTSGRPALKAMHPAQESPTACERTSRVCVARPQHTGVGGQLALCPLFIHSTISLVKGLFGHTRSGSKSRQWMRPRPWLALGEPEPPESVQGLSRPWGSPLARSTTHPHCTATLCPNSGDPNKVFLMLLFLGDSRPPPFLKQGLTT